MKHTLSVLIASVLTAAGSLAADAAPLRVGMELSYPPFEMVAEDGSPAGVSVELAKALGEFLNRPVIIENTAFDGLIPSLKTGKIDLVISSMTATEERARSIDFSEPYLRTGLCLLVGANSPVQSADDLNAPGRTIAVKRGTTGNLHAMKFFPNATLLVLDKENACVLEVIQGKADAFIYDQMSVFQHAARNPHTTRAILKPFKEEAWAVGLRKGNNELRGQVNEFLDHFKAAGGFDRLGSQFLSTQKAAFKAQGIPFLF